MLVFSYILSASVFAFSAFLAFWFSRGKRVVSLISWSFVAVAVVYGLGAIFIFNAVDSGFEFHGSHWVSLSKSIWWLHPFLAFILIFGMCAGWLLPVSIKMVLFRLSQKMELDSRRLVVIAYCLLIFCFLLRYLYVKEYGGFLAYLDYNRAIRSGIFTINNPFSFLQPFGELAFFSSYFFWVLLLEKYRVFLVGVGFIVSVILSLYIHYSYAGRVGFFLYLASFVLIYFYIRRVRATLVLVFAFASIPIAFGFLFGISNYFGVKGAGSIDSFVIDEINHLYTSFFAQMNVGYLYRLFSDFIFAPLHLLPSSLTDGLFETADETNTILLYGGAKGSEGVYGGIPVDLITLGLMQIHIFGVFIVGFLFAWFLSHAEFVCRLINYKPFIYVVMTYISLRLAFVGLLYAHPPHFIGGIFPLFVVILIIFASNIFGKIRI